MSEYVLTYAKILEHLYRQVDSDGNQIHIYDVVVGHSNYKGAIYMADKCYERNSRHYKNNNMAGWYMEVNWEGGITSGFPLNTLKKDNPIGVSQYAVDNNINSELTYDWWKNRLLSGPRD